MTNQATYRFVRKVYTTSRTVHGDAAWDCHHSHFVADQAGDWVEADFGDGSKAYKMAVDCNPRAIARMRAA